jgi:diadenylate cyclase
MAGASISGATKAVAVVVSESAVVRVFDNSHLISEIIPELWMLSRYSLHLTQPYDKSTEEQLTVVSKEE